MEGWKSKVRVAPCLGAGENTAISSWWVAQHHCNLTYAKSRTEATSSHDSYKGIIIRDPGFPGGSDGKSACNMGDPGLIPGVGDPLEKEMATHSSTLAWKIPWTEEPGRL